MEQPKSALGRAYTKVEGASDEGAPPKIWMIIFMALVAILFTIPFLLIWKDLTRLIWENEYVVDNQWIVPVLVIVISFLVGLCVKYLNAETSIHGSISESVESGAAATEYRKFPGSLVSAFLSLLSGASVGPEGALGALVREISSWFEKLFKVTSKEGRLAMSVAALASAYNGIIGQPLFTSVFAVELAPSKKNAMGMMAWTLLAGVIGFLIYAGLGFAAFMGQVPLPPLEGRELEYILEAILLGLLGGLLAMFIGGAFQFFGKLMDRFHDKVILRIFLASLVIATVAYFLPELMFSGEDQIKPILDDPASYGVAMLLLFGILKVLLLGLSFKSGYLGGPIFPVLFSCTMIGLALNLAFPSLPLIIAILCIEAAAISLVLGAPLSSILLVGIVATTGQITPYLIALIVLATVTSMLFGAVLKKLMAKRKAAMGIEAKVD
jgi:H+/Cl- antiporter ClcA